MSCVICQHPEGEQMQYFRGWKPTFSGFKIVSRVPMWSPSLEVAHVFDGQDEARNELRDVQKFKRAAKIELLDRGARL